MRFKQTKTQALLIDVQEKLFPHMNNPTFVESKINTLLEGLKVLEIPITVSEQYTKGLGSTIPSIKQRLENVSFLEKATFSCMDDEKISKEIITNKTNQVLVFGIEAHVCILQTCVDLVKRGYDVCVIVDATDSRNETDKQYAIERMKQEGVFVATVESILLELCRTSASPQFKAISKLIR